MQRRSLKLIGIGAAVLGLLPAAMLYGATRAAPLRHDRAHRLDRRQRQPPVDRGSIA